MIREDLQDLREIPTNLTPWHPEPTVIPNEWRQFMHDLEQQPGGRTRQYLLESVPYDALGTGDLLASWGLSVSTVVAAYLLEYNTELILSSGLQETERVVHHIKEASLYADDIDFERLRPLLTPPYRDLEALLLAVAAYYQALVWLKKHNNGQSYTGKMLIIIESCGRVLLNITKRLGMWQFKREIEDSIEQLSNPVKFEVDQQERERILNDDRELLEEIQCLLASTYYEVAQGPIIVISNPCSVTGMRRRLQDAHTTVTSDKPYLTGFDLVTFDILVPTVRDCYAALGIISQLGSIQDRVTDHIANPKPNGYSHLALGLILNRVKLPDEHNRICQVQIATQFMHAIATYGCIYPKYREHLPDIQSTKQTPPLSLAAHWRSDKGRVFQVIQEIADYEAKLGGADSEKTTPIIVYDKNRRPVSLPTNATALDFAYALGNDVGDVAVEAIVNNRKAPLHRPLEAGDIVEIRTANQSQANATWLEESYAKTRQAKAGIQHALEKREAERRGYELLQEELKQYHYHLSAKELDEEIRFLRNKYQLGPRHIFLQKLARIEEQEPERTGDYIFTPNWAAQEIIKHIPSSEDLNVHGRDRAIWTPVVKSSETGGLVYHNQHICGYCRPAYPRDVKIVGRFRKRNGVLVVHRDTCSHLKDRPLGKHSVLVPMTWLPQPPSFRVSFLTVVEDRKGLILELARQLRRHNSDLTAINAEAANPKTGIGHIRFTIETHSEEEVLDIWEAVYKIQNIVEVIIDPAHTPETICERMNMLYQNRDILKAKAVSEFAWEETVQKLPSRSAFLLSPFDISRPPLQAMFFGRSEEIKRMQRELCEMEQGSALILHGPRRSGKSSICKNFIDHYMRAPHWGVLFSLQNMTRHSEATILAQLAERISNAFGQQLQLKAPQWEDYAINDVQIRFKQLLRDCLAKAEGSRLILALDEFGGALEAYERHTLRFRFFTFWRELMAEIPQLSLVFALPTSAHNLLSSRRFSHIFSFAHPLALSYLDIESAKRLVSDPLKERNIAIHPNTVALAVSMTGGSPYYMTLLGNEIISYLNKDSRKQLISDNDLYAIVDLFIRSEPSQNFQYLKDELQNGEERLLLETLVELMSQANQVEVQLKRLARELHMPTYTARRHLDRLRTGLILEENGPPTNPFYSFKIDLVRQWLSRNRSFFTN